MSEMRAICMRAALEEARNALDAGEVPIGAVVARPGELDGIQIIGRGHNRRESENDPTAHAEMIAIREAARFLGDRRLAGCTLYVTLEPCPMCAGAIVAARLDAVWYGAADSRSGCCGSLYRITEDPAFAHSVPAYGDLLAEECTALLKGFFEHRRNI
jgi:tRNA(adenine34) deaminase